MGHDHHFLSRLDRVQTQLTELALSLYRDDELIRRILTMAEVPEATERIAISLDDERRGPFIIVARNGHFVTCLGEGMGVRDAHVISRARLDDISRYISVLRDRIKLAQVMGGGEQTDLLLKSINSSGEDMSSEEFRGLLAIAELMRETALVFLYKNLQLLLLESAPAVFKSQGTTSKDEQHSRLFYKMIWSHAHLQLIAGAEWQPGNPDPLSLMPPDSIDHRCKVSWAGVRYGWMPMTLRAIRTASLGGMNMLPSLAAQWREPREFSQVLHALFSLVAVAVRDPSTREAVLEILSLPPGHDSASEDRWKPFHDAYHWRALSVIDDPDRAIARTIEAGKDIVVIQGQHLPVGALAHYRHAHEVPEELACAAVANFPFGSLNLGTGTRLALNAAAWAARAPAEAFYPDRAYLISLRPRWSFEVAKIIAGCVCEDLLIRGKDAPRERQKPNEPCSCGSGRKYKKCCGSVVAG